MEVRKGVNCTMPYVIAILSLLCLTLLLWVIHLKGQLRSISRQLEKRLLDDTHHSVSVSLLDPDATRLAAAINRCLAADEETRLTLRREEKAFRDTIANISHDLRTPITAVKGYLQLLTATPLSELQQQRVAVISRHVQELGDLIEHFFAYSCLLSDESELHLEKFCLTDEVAECLAAAVPQFEERHIAVQLGHWEQTALIADREKTVRIVQNLVRNCLQHAAGDVTVSVEQAGDGPQGVKLMFSNPVGNQDSIDVGSLFDRFYTADKSRHKKSTGLGLSIVKLLAEQLGGHVFAVLTDNVISIGVAF